MESLNEIYSNFGNMLEGLGLKSMFENLNLLVDLTQKLGCYHSKKISIENFVAMSVHAFNSFEPETNYLISNTEFCVSFAPVLTTYAAYLYWQSKNNFAQANHFLSEWQNLIQVKTTEDFKNTKPSS